MVVEDCGRWSKIRENGGCGGDARSVRVEALVVEMRERRPELRWSGSRVRRQTGQIIGNNDRREKES